MYLFAKNVAVMRYLKRNSQSRFLTFNSGFDPKVVLFLISTKANIVLKSYTAPHRQVLFQNIYH